jgi:tyrosyl-tRNA synthetase
MLNRYAAKMSLPVCDLVQGGGLSLNKVKIDNPDIIIGREYLLNNKYLLVQKGKKNYYLIRVN